MKGLLELWTLFWPWVGIMAVGFAAVLSGCAAVAPTAEPFQRVAQDIQKNEGTRSAVQKIIGAGERSVIKYSPVTGKHYSGELDIDPETGVKLEILKE